MVWSALECNESVAELAHFVKMILGFVPNQAGCERLFSDLRVKQTHRRNRLGLAKLEKMTKVSLFFIHTIIYTNQNRSGQTSKQNIKSLEP